MSPTLPYLERDLLPLPLARRRRERTQRRRSPALTADHLGDVLRRHEQFDERLVLVLRFGDADVVRAIGQRLCEPCVHLERLTRPGVVAGLVHRGGLRADILTDGEIRLGDKIEAGVIQPL